MIVGLLSFAVRPQYDVYDLAESANATKRVLRNPENTVDVLFAGDSEAGYGFAPLMYWRDHGISAENIGYPNERLGDTYAMLKTIYDKQKVKLLVLETDSFFADARVFANDDAVLEKAEELIPLLHYHKVWKFLKPEGITRGEGDKNSNKGYWLRRGVKPYTGRKDYISVNSSRDEEISAEAKTYLSDILSLCSENGTEVLIVTAPGPAYWTKQRNTLVTEWCRENGLTYVDMNYYNDEIGFDWSKDTMDSGAHMNHEGCAKMNLWFADYLMKYYSLPDHRGDKRYQSWQDDYEFLRGTY